MHSYARGAVSFALVATCLGGTPRGMAQVPNMPIPGQITPPPPASGRLTVPALPEMTPDPAGRPATPDLGEPSGRSPDMGDTGDRSIDRPPSPPTILEADVHPIDLNTALRLAGVQNPQLMIARQRVVEAAALRQLAAVQILPSINYGMNYDSHNGNLQQSNGNILAVNRSAVYVGAGSGAVAAGTVAVPGVLLQGNIAVGVFGYLMARQQVAVRDFNSIAVRNQAFLQTTLAYSELLRAEGRRAVAIQVRDEAKRVADLTAAYARAGQGREADAHRALTELQSRENDIQGAEGDVLTSSAQLCFVLNLDPSIRLHPTDAWVVPHPIVPDPTHVSELIALGLLQRPELKAQQAAIRQALLALDGSKVLPFSPTILIGFSSGGFGGGSNLVSPVFGAFGGRSDFDAVGYWTLQNLGVGNLSLINLAKARMGVARYEQIAVLDQVRAEVAEAYARTHARYAQILTAERGVLSGTKGFREDLIRIQNTVAPAIETIDSLRLLARARYSYLNSIVDYDRAQFELYVALGQPPADALARPVPTAGVAPPGEPLEVNPGSPLRPASPAMAPPEARSRPAPAMPVTAAAPAPPRQ